MKLIILNGKKTQYVYVGSEGLKKHCKEKLLKTYMYIVIYTYMLFVKSIEMFFRDHCSYGAGLDAPHGLLLGGFICCATITTPLPPVLPHPACIWSHDSLLFHSTNKRDNIVTSPKILFTVLPLLCDR